ncbi:MAG TPA: hypothetical protein VLE95_00695 [Chlamydiales bacterium]|nr:hypothetical protein [Chlamydiales bacterium]
MSSRIFGMAISFFVFFASQCFCSQDRIIVEAQKNMLDVQETKVSMNNNKWQNFLTKVRNDILNFENVVEAIHYAQNTGEIGFDHRGVVPVNLLKDFEESLKQEFPHFSQFISQVEESPYSPGHLQSHIIALSSALESA